MYRGAVWFSEGQTITFTGGLTMSTDVLTFLLKRRSLKPVLMGGPGPDADQLQQMLTVAARVPDHKKLVPWRFIVFEGDARARFGEALADACKAEEKEPPSSMRLDTERRRFMDAPLVIAVISRATPTAGAPEWEQILSAGAACFNLCLSANALGFASNWLTGWYAYSPAIRMHLKLADNERIAGFVYVGTAKEAVADRERPDLGRIVSRY